MNSQTEYKRIMWEQAVTLAADIVGRVCMGDLNDYWGKRFVWNANRIYAVLQAGPEQTQERRTDNDN